MSIPGRQISGVYFSVPLTVVELRRLEQVSFKLQYSFKKPIDTKIHSFKAPISHMFQEMNMFE